MKIINFQKFYYFIYLSCVIVIKFGILFIDICWHNIKGEKMQIYKFAKILKTTIVFMITSNENFIVYIVKNIDHLLYALNVLK